MHVSSQELPGGGDQALRLETAKVLGALAEKPAAGRVRGLLVRKDFGQLVAPGDLPEYASLRRRQ